MMPGQEPSAYDSARILLVEDDPNDQRFLRRALEKTGRRIVLKVAHDGESALEYLAGFSAGGENPDMLLVLSDIHLPGRSGWDVLEWIRRHPHLSTLPVLLWTSLPTPEGAERARCLGARRYLSKPRSLDGYSTVATALLSILGD
jgi:CheY-like chemotaxis protein